DGIQHPLAIAARRRPENSRITIADIFRTNGASIGKFCITQVKSIGFPVRRDFPPFGKRWLNFGALAELHQAIINPATYDPFVEILYKCGVEAFRLIRLAIVEDLMLLILGFSTATAGEQN